MTHTLAPRILRIVDTRDMIEHGDRFVPIPGTGTLATCDRCGRGHEVHVTVEHADGRVETVGTGCAGRGDAYARKAASSATSVARLRAELARRTADAERYNVAATEIAARPIPAHTITPDEDTSRGREAWTIPGTTVTVWSDRWADPTERLACLASSYRAHLLRELFGADAYRMSVAGDKAADAARRLARAEARLAAVVAE